MQHWTLWEVLAIANGHHSDLNYIDAHAMAPFSQVPVWASQVFKRVQQQLPVQGSGYEKAWHSLASTMKGYPSSAAFVTEVWKGDYSLLLCEVNQETINEIEPWLSDIRGRPQCKDTELCVGDWRVRFENGLLRQGGLALAKDGLTFLSFDPYMISKSEGRFKKDSGSMYPQDLETISQALKDFHGEILMQLSTYTTNGGNSHEDVAKLVDSHLGSYGFRRVVKTRVKGKKYDAKGYMMSLVYARYVEWAHELEPLGDRFTEWLNHFGDPPTPRRLPTP